MSKVWIRSKTLPVYAVRAQFPHADSTGCHGVGLWVGAVGDERLRLMGGEAGSTREVEKIPRRVTKITHHALQALASGTVRLIDINKFVRV